jgi:hypothetical protein
MRKGLFVIIITLAGAQAWADVPTSMNMQGRLTDSAGNSIGERFMEFGFTIWDAPTGGAVIWPGELQEVYVDLSGLWNARIGAMNPLTADVFADTSRWLEVTVGDSANLPDTLPRIKLNTTPYTYRSASSQQADVAALALTVADHTVTSASIQDGSIGFVDIAQNGADAGQVVKWDGSEWVAAPDVSGMSWSWSDSSSHGPDSVLYADQAQSSNQAGSADYADSTDAITDGAVDLADLGQNGAAMGQVMKWGGSAWAAANDDTGTHSGWVDDGNVIRLETAADSVGIGTASPSERLEVAGNIKATGTVRSGASMVIDGVNDRITATSGTIDFDDENLTTTGKASIGPNHTNTGIYAFVAGSNNVARGDYATVAGGGGVSTSDSNSAAGAYAAVGGGRRNTAGGVGAAVGGGHSNTASQDYATVGGGQGNMASSGSATVGGGWNNTSSGGLSTVAGGYYNTASQDWSTVAGGTSNTASGVGAAIGGGQANIANRRCAMVPGGLSNLAAGYCALAAGRRAKADHNGVFIWADHTDVDFSSTAEDQFLIRAAGGVGIGTASPAGALDVSSTTGGLIVPRMSTTERNALTAVNGMIIYNTTDDQFNFYEAGAWVTK